MASNFFKLLCLALAAGLISSGGLLVFQEAGLVQARYLTRPGEFYRPADSIERAMAALSSTTAARADSARSVLQAVLALDDLASDESAKPVLHSRIRAAAVDVLRLAPLDVQSWCALALVDAKSDGTVTARVIDEIRLCYEFGPRTIGVLEARLLLVLSHWDALPQGVRNGAMIDIAASLTENYFSGWMADVLAFAIATSAPQRAELAEKMLDQYAPSQRVTYTAALDRYRSEAALRNLAQ